MKYFRENKSLLLKYLMIIITNILLFIFCEYYFRNSEYSSIVTFMSVTIFDYIIYYYKKTKKFVVCIDILCCFIVGTIMLFFINNSLMYSYYLFILFFANNIVFMLSRKSEKIIMRSLQYLSILLITFLCMCLNLLLFMLIFGM